MSEKLFVSAKDESVRIFKSDILDKMSRVHFTMPLVLYVPVVIYCLYIALAKYSNPVWLAIILFGMGVFIWTLAEYILHRFVFHYEPTTQWGKRLHFLTHGIHHDYPNDSKRLVMVPVISIPLCVFFYTLFYYILTPPYVHAYFAGFVAGYLYYDMVHYALHHAQFKNKYWQKMKNYHMRHHYLEPHNGFGVSNTFWDVVFNSCFKKN